MVLVRIRRGLRDRIQSPLEKLGIFQPYSGLFGNKGVRVSQGSCTKEGKRRLDRIFMSATMTGNFWELNQVKAQEETTRFLKIYGSYVRV